MLETHNYNQIEPPAMPTRTAKWGAKIREWIRRYLLADLAATVTGIAGVYFATKAGANLVTVAYVGSITEAIGYYTPLFVRDYRTQRGFEEKGAIRRTVRNLVLEFGVAEVFDSALFRPMFMALCIKLIPNLFVATYVGMTVADITFYSQAIVGYELRKRFLPDPANAESTQTLSRRRNSATVVSRYIEHTTTRAADLADDDITVISVDGQVDDADSARAVSRSIVGHLIRITDDESLPEQLPIYALATDDGKPRQIYIGRHSKNNTVVIQSKRISREHAMVVQKEGRLYLRDNASTLGTYLNWRKLRFGEELLIRDKDQISFGDISYEFRITEES